MDESIDDIARRCLRPVRGCATDDQYCEALSRVTTAIALAKTASVPPCEHTGELVTVEGDGIVIRITLDELVFATEHGVLCTFDTHKNDFRKVSVTGPEQWRDAIVRALRRKQENGDTPVHLLLDAALEYAAEQGEEGVEIEGGGFP